MLERLDKVDGSDVRVLAIGGGFEVVVCGNLCVGEVGGDGPATVGSGGRKRGRGMSGEKR